MATGTVKWFNEGKGFEPFPLRPPQVTVAAAPFYKALFVREITSSKLSRYNKRPLQQLIRKLGL